MRLDLLLIARHPALSRRRARAAIEGGQVEVAGRVEREPGHEVAEQAALAFFPNRPRRPKARLPFQALHDDGRVEIAPLRLLHCLGAARVKSAMDTGTACAAMADRLGRAALAGAATAGGGAR